MPYTHRPNTTLQLNPQDELCCEHTTSAYKDTCSAYITIKLARYVTEHKQKEKLYFNSLLPFNEVHPPVGNWSNDLTLGC